MVIKIFKLFVHGAPQRYIVDAKFLPKLRKHTWRYAKKANRAQAVVSYKQRRVRLPNYVARIAGKNWVEVFFANQNPFDCRIGNLCPYDRAEHGAARRFKNNKSGFRGVYFKKTTSPNKWGASIRIKGHLQHLGYFATPEIAARVYRDAYRLAHPNLKP